MTKQGEYAPVPTAFDHLRQITVMRTDHGWETGGDVTKRLNESPFAKRGKVEADLSVICSAVDQFQLDMRRYPTASEGLAVLQADPVGGPDYRGPYLKSIPDDPWSHHYIYNCLGSNCQEYEVVSYGADGASGGTGENEDIREGSSPH